MTKAEIVDRICEATAVSRKESFNLLEDFLELMKATLEKGEKIKIAGFGNFEVRKKADRRGRNPQTGEEIIISSLHVLTFKPSTILRARINGED